MKEGSIELVFRDAGPQDVPALVGLIETAYRGDESFLGWTTEAGFIGGERTSTDEVAGVIGADRSAMLVAEDALEGIVGCCRVESRVEGAAYLGMLAVRPTLQGGGLGRALVTLAEERARAWGAVKIELSVISRRVELIAWYARLGYEATGAVLAKDDPTTVAVAGRDDLVFAVMAKPLSAP